MSNTHVLSDRSLQLLKTLVERYISDGQPVGSKVLAQEANLSPATIRNVMADLEQQGFIQSPHTSAGRVPTVSGYRLFVDNLLTVKALNSADLSRLHQGLSAEDNSDVIGAASRLLAELTQMAGVVTLPRRDLVCLRHIEFLPLSNTRVLVIFVTNEQEVHNKIIHTAKVFSAAELQQAANYLNSIYYGRSLADVRVAVGGGDVRMAQKFLDHAQVCSILEQVRCKAVAQRMRRDVLRNTSLLCIELHALPNR